MKRIEKLLLSDIEGDILMGYYLAKRRFRYIGLFNFLQGNPQNPTIDKGFKLKYQL